MASSPPIPTEPFTGTSLSVIEMNPRDIAVDCAENDGRETEWMKADRLLWNVCENLEKSDENAGNGVLTAAS